jgi:hypothetical protein
MPGRRYALCLLLLTALVVPGCASPSRVTYIPEGGSYTAGDLADALDDTDPGAAARVKSDEAAEVRQESLANLRRMGDEAAALADMLTSQFPTDTTAIPYRVERGLFDAQPAWIVYEAWGDPGEALSGRRVWVFSQSDLAVLAASSTP